VRPWPVLVALRDEGQYKGEVITIVRNCTQLLSTTKKFKSKILEWLGVSISLTNPRYLHTTIVSTHQNKQPRLLRIIHNQMNPKCVPHQFKERLLYASRNQHQKPKMLMKLEIRLTRCLHVDVRKKTGPAISPAMFPVSISVIDKQYICWNITSIRISIRLVKPC
jgi:hypothetical protein